jgi:hypothetical protein
MDALAVFNVRASVHMNKITELDTEVITGNLVYLDPALLDVVRAQADQDRITPLLASVDSMILS